MKTAKNILAFVLISFWILLSFSSFAQNDNEADNNLQGNAGLKTILQVLVDEDIVNRGTELFPKKTKIIDVQKDDSKATVNFTKEFALNPIRLETINKLDALFGNELNPEKNKKFIIEYQIDGRPIDMFIPRWYLEGKSKLRDIKKESNKKPIVQKIRSEIFLPTRGLFNRNIALWSSHGWYFDTKQNKRWEWQRPRMFTIVEDTHNMAVVNQYLIPMLENAGANVFSPRERDMQINEVIIDNDDVDSKSTNGLYIESGDWSKGDGFGFKNGLAPYEQNFNPHEKGTNRIAQTSKKQSCTATFIPNIPETGYYGVTVSYKHNKENSCEDAKYTVFHSGGETTFYVNQTMGGGTWIFLGTFHFKKGINKDMGCVILSNENKTEGKTISADAVRFGGGMGNILRDGKVSGYPRYLEAGLYYMQYAGAPSDLVYNLGLGDGLEGPDYTNDYAGRGEFINWLVGNPFGPNKNRQYEGLGIPVDLSLSLHTDAGITTGIVGFLSIYREKDSEGNIVFPDGRPRLLNRELADLIQSEVLKTIHTKYSSTFSSRDLRDSDYSESRRPNVPCALIESLSHQNFNDMKYYLDPRFRFDFARSIYKAMLKFIASEYDFKPVIQPLPPKELILKKHGDDSAIISWKPVVDPLEPTAEPEDYILYTRIDDNGFDNGILVRKTACTIKKIDPHKIYSFKVAAINTGGESFPSETVSLYIGKNENKRILIVNGFDRLAPPAMSVGDMAGFRRDLDRGVDYIANYAITGDQWDFDSKSEFRTNDHPGHGASYGNIENKTELGNTFDFIYIHGKSIAASGYGFDSASHLAVENQMVEMDDYAVVDWILGEQKETLPPEGFQGIGDPDKMKPEFKTFSPLAQILIKDYAEAGGKLFVSGAYVATDLETSRYASSDDKAFLKDILKSAWSTNFGSRTNNIFAAHGSPFMNIPEFHFASDIGENCVYGVENPDAIEPAEKSGAIVAFRYKDAGFSAGIAYKSDKYSCVVLGFPFETITSDDSKNILMAEILNYLLK